MCSLNELLFLYLLYALLVLVVASFYFLGDTSNPDLETTIHVFHGSISHSCDVQACAPPTRISSAEPWEPQWSKKY